MSSREIVYQSRGAEVLRVAFDSELRADRTDTDTPQERALRVLISLVADVILTRERSHLLRSWAPRAAATHTIRAFGIYNHVRWDSWKTGYVQESVRAIDYYARQAAEIRKRVLDENNGTIAWGEEITYNADDPSPALAALKKAHTEARDRLREYMYSNSELRVEALDILDDVYTRVDYLMDGRLREDG